MHFSTTLGFGHAKVRCDKCNTELKKYGITFKGLEVYIAYGCVKCLTKKLVKEEDDK